MAHPPTVKLLLTAAAEILAVKLLDALLSLQFLTVKL